MVQSYKAAASSHEEEPLLPRAGRSDLTPLARGGCLRCLEDVVAFTQDEMDAHQRLLELAGVPLDNDSPQHEACLRSYWNVMIGGEYEAKSRKWREVGFQGDDPRTDFRGGGLLALKCMCFMAEKHGEEAVRWASQAREGSSDMLFSAACINVCGLLLVQLHLNAQSIVPPVPTARPACNLALKHFTHQLPNAESELEVFGELFVAVVAKLCAEWQAFLTRRPDGNLMHFGEVLRDVNQAVECALCSSQQPQEALQSVNATGGATAIRCWLARCQSSLLLGLLQLLRCLSCSSREARTLT